MTDHVKILGWLHIVMGGISLVAGLGIAAMFGGVAILVGASDAQAPAGLFALIGLGIAAIMLITSLPTILAGVGLLRWRSWARILAIVLAVLNVLNFPLGTALSVYTFVVLFQPEVVAAFERGPYPADVSAGF
jgi:hypothetical protein